MLVIILITLFLGIILGLLFAICSLFYLLKIKCPQCKQLRPVKEIILCSWKERVITGQACQPCQEQSKKPKPQIDIEL